MYAYSSSQLLFYLIVLIVFAAYFLLRRWLNNRPSLPVINDSDDASLIITMYTLGVSLQPVSDGTLNGYHYSFLATGHNDLPTQVGDGQLRSPVGQLIMNLNLPAKSQVHIAGFSVQDSVVRELLGNTNVDNTLAKVELEGDFPDYFRLYCDRGREIELREILDPVVMEFLVDFCKDFNWELIESSLYFAQSGTAQRQGDNMTMVQAVEEFTQKVLPKLQRMSTPSIPPKMMAS